MVLSGIDLDAARSPWGSKPRAAVGRIIEIGACPVDPSPAARIDPQNARLPRTVLKFHPLDVKADGICGEFVPERRKASEVGLPARFADYPVAGSLRDDLPIFPFPLPCPSVAGEESKRSIGASGMDEEKPLFLDDFFECRCGYIGVDRLERLIGGDVV